VISLIRLEGLPEAVKARLLGRIGAMVSVHEAMYRSDQFEEICIRPYLDRLVQDVADGYGLPVQVRLDIAEVRISGARAMLLGLLVNELVSNAFKHAFAPRGGGSLHVSVEGRGDGTLRLCVADDGPGFTATEQAGHMGSRLIEAFAQQLGGSIAVESAGRTVVTLDFPQDYLAAPQPSPADPAGQPRAAQPISVLGALSRKSIRLSR
jgi:two-component sensor histidine kinase